MNNIRDDEIRIRAHQLWEQAGKPEGKEVDFWLQAERQLQQEEGRAKREEHGGS